MQIESRVLVASLLIAFSFFLLMLSFVARSAELNKRYQKQFATKPFTLNPFYAAKRSFGRAGFELKGARMVLVYVVSSVLSYVLFNIVRVFLQDSIAWFVFVLLVFILPIFAGYLIAMVQRVLFRQALIQWMFDAASESAVERNFERLMERVAKNSRNKMTRKEVSIIIRNARAKNQSPVEQIFERAELWGMPTYRYIAVFSKVLVDYGGNLKDGYLAIRDSLRRQEMREQRIKKKTMANRVIMFGIIFLYLFGLIFGYSGLKELFLNNPLLEIWYYSLYVICFGVLVWLLWYTRRSPN